MTQPLPLALPKVWPSTVKVIFSDIDDTLTWKGRLPVETFQALQRLKEAGIRVIPVTGACAGWADCIVRTWPVDTVIAENGSFWMERNDEGFVERHFMEKPEDRAQYLEQLQKIAEEFHSTFPQINFTEDQNFRLTDIAFDIGQQVKIEAEQARQAAQWWSKKGLNARLSSIHINVWAGSYTKAKTSQKWLENHPDIHADDCIFIGDSLNDDTMFQQYQHSVGVANISPYLEDLVHMPQYITSQNGGYGFCQLADCILSAV
ncbi:MAG: HAD family phosphatase [Methylocystaceae bacterium]|nr:HAD family phosphatase [Methylocystaceae bacterium]